METDNFQLSIVENYLWVALQPTNRHLLEKEVLFDFVKPYEEAMRVERKAGTALAF